VHAPNSGLVCACARTSVLRVLAYVLLHLRKYSSVAQAVAQDWCTWLGNDISSYVHAPNSGLVCACARTSVLLAYVLLHLRKYSSVAQAVAQVHLAG